MWRRQETHDPSTQARRQIAESRRPRHRDRASDPAALARERHRRQHRDAVRSRHGALHHARRCRDHRPTSAGWRNAAVISGHWALHGFGMFVVEEKSSRRYIGRVGPWCPPGWPGFEVGWGIDQRLSRQGLCASRRRGRRSTGRLRPSRSTRSFTASTPVTNRQSASHDGWERSTMARSILLGKSNERWVTSRTSWKADR